MVPKAIASRLARIKATATVLDPKASVSSTDTTAVGRIKTLPSACLGQNGNVLELTPGKHSPSAIIPLETYTHHPLSPMLTTLLHLFIFSSWGLGLLAALSALSMKLQSHSLSMKSREVELESDTIEVSSKRAFIDKINGLGKPPAASGRIPDELAKLISSSPEHPEVNEIDGDDEVYGVVFQAHSYPPSMDDNDDDE